MNLLDKARDFLLRRQQSYIKVFRHNVYGERVLGDLAKFCRANESCFHPDARMSAILEGRREVWLRISQHLNLSPDEIWELHNPMRGKDD